AGGRRGLPSRSARGAHRAVDVRPTTRGVRRRRDRRLLGGPVSARSAEEVRADLGHPVVAADGHILEFIPAVLPYRRGTRGAEPFETYRSGMRPIDRTVTAPKASVRARTREPIGTWWGTPAANTRDLATATIPRLLY